MRAIDYVRGLGEDLDVPALLSVRRSSSFGLMHELYVLCGYLDMQREEKARLAAGTLMANDKFFQENKDLRLRVSLLSKQVEILTGELTERTAQLERAKAELARPSDYAEWSEWR